MKQPTKKFVQSLLEQGVYRLEFVDGSYVAQATLQGGELAKGYDDKRKKHVDANFSYLDLGRCELWHADPKLLTLVMAVGKVEFAREAE